MCWQGPEKKSLDHGAEPSCNDAGRNASARPDAPDPFSLLTLNTSRKFCIRQAGAESTSAPIGPKLLSGRVGLREAALHAYEFGPVKAVAESTGQVPSEDVLRVIEDALAPYEIDGVVQLPGAAWIATAHNS